jgi:ATP-dependent Clp protease ATP-binding subunit ClpA
MNDTLSTLRGLEGHLKSRLLGQDRPLEAITGLLSRSMLGMRYPGKPVASMLLAGGTGTGKTQSVLLFTDYLFGDAVGKLVQFDCSELMNMSALERLIGNRVGERGLFGYHFDRSGGSGTILFDEVEKAHPLVLDILLQILGCGRFSLGTGETLDLSNYVVAATTNLGSQVLLESETEDDETLRSRVAEAVQGEMRPELVARFELHCVFNAIGHSQSRQIAALHLARALGIINGLGHRIQAGPGVLGHVRAQGYDRKYGVRPMENAAMQILGDVVKQALFKNGGKPVCGTVHYSPQENRCFLEG